MEEDRKTIRITKPLMRRIIALIKQAEQQGIPVPSVQDIYDAAMRVGLDVMESTGDVPAPEEAEQMLIPDLPEHRRGRRPKFTGTPIRQYLHGDPIGAGIDRYFCKYHEDFVTADHFAGCKLSLTHEMDYIIDRQKWFKKSTKGHAQRGFLVAMNDPNNIFVRTA